MTELGKDTSVNEAHRLPFISTSLCSLRSFAAEKFVAGPSRSRGFTLLEMMITLAIFILLAAAVFGLMTGVLQSTSTLQDNSNRRDRIEALNAFLKNKLGEMPAAATLVSYMRGEGEGLTQNGIIFGNSSLATAIDAKVQPNGYYALRLTTFATEAGQTQPQDARQVLQQAVTTDDPTLVWTSLIADIKTLNWKFQDLNVIDWVNLWSSTSKPNLVEFSMQPAGDLQTTTMDFWIPKIEAVSVSIAPQPKTTP
jgi:prepilin-type N-terminal cleavage/methylation domain-containing protein